ncbi:hypothetical protein ADL22_12225 [Streptomyces sp. NRRL F-4489]|uniref:hypothetical protein n=1 Tax=Streptomyces sp. NRRL F-4489 TaxID=1609095 RepID=UPI00074919F6|nr:hypothetical protein [Streptomyces sp. NRRL F-4489]KUL44703.1 hypothetical protein ADL22_12225 [Streptomyces sp. NRRL F-4489]
MALGDFSSGVLNGAQFGKVGRELSNMATGTQPMERTSMAANIIGGLAGADTQYRSGVLARINEIQNEARTRGITPDQVVKSRQSQQTGMDTVTRYAGSNPVRNSQVRAT